MKLRHTFGLMAFAGLAAIAAPAHAAVTFQYLFSGGYPLQISSDGTVIAGNTVGSYEPFRWTQATGLVNLGHGSLAVTGGTSGAPGMSADGTRIASTIVGPDSTYATAGRWTQGSGWEFVAPPVPPGGGVSDRELASVWGMSGDGSTVVGLYWRPGGRAHAYSWTQAGGMVDLGALASNRASRANGASWDGSVVGGFGEDPQYGLRRPVAWRNGEITALNEDGIPGEVHGVSDDGNWVYGNESNQATGYVDATRWHWDGGAWGPSEYLGHVEGNSAGFYGKCVAYDQTSDGNLVIGYNSFDGDPSGTTGFIWTDSTGVMDIEFWLADKGVVLDPLFDIKSLYACTNNGEILIGSGQDIVAPYTTRAFMIHTGRGYLGVEPVVTKPQLQLAAAPNPARNGTSLSFTLGAAGHARLGVYDASGRLVRSVVDGELPSGSHHVAWDGRDSDGQTVHAGIYFMKLESGGTSTGAKLVVLQ